MGLFGPGPGIIFKCWNLMPALPRGKATAGWQLQWGRRRGTWRLQLMRPCLITLIQNLRLFSNLQMLFTKQSCGWTSTVQKRQRMLSCRPSQILSGRSLLIQLNGTAPWESGPVISEHPGNPLKGSKRRHQGRGNCQNSSYETIVINDFAVRPWQQLPRPVG